MSSTGDDDAGPSSGSAACLREERMKRLRDLQMRRNEARKLNHQEVVEEDKRNKLPVNHEKKRGRIEWEIEDDKKREEAKAQGVDYERVKSLETQADHAEASYRKKQKKTNPDEGFSTYAAATARQYGRLTQQMKPDMDAYVGQIEELGEEVFNPNSTVVHGTHKPSSDAVSRMVVDLDKQIKKRAKFSRRRTHNDDDDIDYINQRNAKFNKKLERFYGEYTAEIKQNLERGTAI